MIEPVERWIVCVTGFCQPESRATGVEILQDRLHRLCGNPFTRVLLRAWDDSPWHCAERIWTRRPPVDPPRVVLIGYSWGGYTANEIAKQLHRRGLAVDALLLCDAVWRSRTIFGRPLSMLDCWTIRVPANVRRCFVWRQTANRPRGARVVVTDPITEITESVLPHLAHQYMDDLPEFHKIASLVACPRNEVPAA